MYGRMVASTISVMIVSMIAAHAIALEFVLADRVAVIRPSRLKALNPIFTRRVQESTDTIVWITIASKV